MKDEKAKYLFVEAEEMFKQLYIVQSIPIFNYFDNTYYRDKKISVQEIFDKNNIPKEFQKIIIKINIRFLLKPEAEEYTMGFPFDIKTSKVEKNSKEKYISIANCPIIYDNHIFKDKINFRTKIKYHHHTEIMLFLKEIKESGYLEPYLQSIKEIFDISINLDYLLQIWEEEKDATKTLKRYKQKFLIKKN